MKKACRLFSLIGLCILFYACPYQTSVPIDNPKLKIDINLIGTWEEEKDHDIYKVTEHDEYSYSIEEIDKKSNNVSHYLAYFSEINNTLFMNFWEDKPGIEKKYMLFKLEKKDANTIDIFPVTENIREVFKSSEELKKFITGGMKNSYFFEQESTLIRTK